MELFDCRNKDLDVLGLKIISEDYSDIIKKLNLFCRLAYVDDEYTTKPGTMSTIGKPVTKGFVVSEHQFNRIKEEAVKSLGLRKDSKIIKDFMDGKITYARALRDAKIVTTRHHATRYDSLLQLGYTKEEARNAVNDELNTLLGKKNQTRDFSTGKWAYGQLKSK